MTVGKPTTNGSAAQQRPSLREAVARLAPGTGLRDGLERILRGRTGALIVLGYEDSVEAICDGGVALVVRVATRRPRGAPTRGGPRAVGCPTRPYLLQSRPPATARRNGPRSRPATR